MKNKNRGQSMKLDYLKKIVTVVIMFSLLGFFQAANPFTAESPHQTLTYELSFEDFQITQTTQGDEVTIDSFGRLLIMGKPNLPSKIISIAVPPNAEIKDVIVHSQETILLDGTYEIPPCPVPQIIGENEPNGEMEETYESNYLQTYSTDDPYPEQIGEFLRPSQYRKYELVDIRINPFTYYPLSEKLAFHKDIIIDITYEEKEKSNDAIEDYLEQPEQFANQIIANYDQSQIWYESTIKEQKGLYNYVIITLDSLTSSVTSLVDWEESKGRNVNVVTTSWIDTNYDGIDLQEKMRNFLREKYPSSEWGIEYLLLVGHYDDVPVRRTAQDMGYGQPETDFYYAELSLPDSESWDSNENNQYGEDSDAIDFYSEISVGRIPWSDPSIVESICNKTVSYEQNDDQSYKKNILLLGAFFWADTDNAELMEEIAGQSWMNDWTKTRMYEQSQSSYPSDYDLGYDNVESDWSSNTYGFVNWAGHGSPTACYEYYPSQAFVDTDTCDSLNDDYPAIIFADACSNQDTDEFNLGQAMMQQGGVGYLGATKVAYGQPGWDSPYDGSSQSLDYFFTTKVTSGELSAGQAHQWALTEMYTNGLWTAGTAYETFEWGVYLGNPDLFMFLPAVEFSFPDGLPDFIDPNVETVLTVQINEVGDNIVSGSELLHYRFDDGSFQTVPLTHNSGNLYEAMLPAASCGDTPEFYFSVDTVSSGLQYSPSDAPSSTYTCMVGSLDLFFTDDFETNQGWIVENDEDLTEGAWERGIPIDDNRGDPPTDYDGSGQCYITGNSDDEDIDGGTTYLISPTFDLETGEDAYVSYALWYTNNFGADPNNDYFNTYISNDDGANWVLAQTIGPNSLSGWVEQGFMIGDVVSLTDQMKIRFEASDLNDGSVVEAGIDAFELSIFNCEASGPILDFQPESLSFGPLQTNETDVQSFEIWNAGSNMLNYSFSETAEWLDLSLLSGNSTGEHDMITVEVDAMGLSPGSYTETIIISSNGGNGDLPVSLYILSGDEVTDVIQEVSDRGFPIRHANDGDWAAAQDYTPSVSAITRVDVYLRSFGTPEFDLTIELRKDDPQGTLLDSLTFIPGEVPTSWAWFEIDFEDQSVSSGSNYFIVIPPAPSGVTSSFGYEWGYAFGDLYADGSFWFTRDGGGLWRDLPESYEFAFRTYGLS
jgi:hypothetical protein